MKHQLTLGVIGHVDHGKTALIKALTGVDTDRLAEEKRRGLSIVLGFSYLETANGIIDLIDAPGHEDFVRAMISGATGIDGALLVVAANEGIMPQTREHFDIARLLDLDRGIVVVTKADLAPRAELDALREALRAFVAGSFLKAAPVVETSSANGAGIAELKATLETLAERTIERPAGGDFYLPLDRVFTMRGFGLVATGTLRGGYLRLGDPVEIQPGGRVARLRAMQCHGQSVEFARPGQRVAVNLRGVKRDELKRGDTLAAPGLLTPSRRVDAELQLLDSHDRGLKNGAALRLLLGTTEAVARIRLLDRQILAPGETAFAQLRLDRDIVSRRGEHVLIRSYSPMRTIGGGRVVDPNAARHKRFDDAVGKRLATAAAGDVAAIVEQSLAGADVDGIDLTSIADNLGIPAEQARGRLNDAAAVGIGGDRFVGQAAVDDLSRGIIEALERFHAEQPKLGGLGASKLRKSLPATPAQDVFDHALQALAARGELSNKAGLISLAGFDPLGGLDQRERALVGELEKSYRDCGLETPQGDELLKGLKAPRQLQQLLIDGGRLIKLRTYDRKTIKFVHADTLHEARERIEGRYPHPQQFAVSDIRDLLGSTRKHVVPLMEHFDATGFTARVGDKRYVQPQSTGGE